MESESEVLAFQQLTPDQMLDAVDSVSDDRCDGRFLALNSYENRVYQIGLENGSNIVAKFYRPKRWSDRSIIEEHSFTTELADHEIPVVAPLKDIKGNSLFIHDQFRFSLYPSKGGRTIELDNPDHLELMGRMVGRIHATASKKPFQHRPKVDIQSYVIDARKCIQESGFLPAHLDLAYNSLCDDLQIRIENCFSRAGETDQIRLHADMHASNVLWTDDGAHIVDFDDARTGPAIQDIWMFLSGERDYMQKMLLEFLEGYRQFNDFNGAELHLVEALRTMRMIHYSAWLVARWQDPAFQRAFPWFNEIQYWEGQILALREQAALMDEAPLMDNY